MLLRIHRRSGDSDSKGFSSQFFVDNIKTWKMHLSISPTNNDRSLKKAEETDEISEPHETETLSTRPLQQAEPPKPEPPPRETPAVPQRPRRTVKKVEKKNLSTTQAQSMSSHKQPSPKPPNSLTAFFFLKSTARWGYYF